MTTRTNLPGSKRPCGVVEKPVPASEYRRDAERLERMAAKYAGFHDQAHKTVLLRAAYGLRAEARRRDNDE